MKDFNCAPNSHPKDAEYLAKLQDYYVSWKSIPSYASLCEVLALPRNLGLKRFWIGFVKPALSNAHPTERGYRHVSFLLAHWLNHQFKQECRFR